MYAIVNIAGQQFKVMNNQKIFVHRLEGKEDSSVTFDEVLLIEDDGKVLVGTPQIEGAAVSAKILEHMKADKVLVFKKKRRKGYKKLNGHRQLLTKIQIEKIEEKASKKAATKKEKPEKVVEVAETKTKEEAKPATKKPTAKKPATKKAAPKATAKKKPAAKKTEKKSAKSESASGGKDA
ncbi:MAG TPA: 50S ribosomal protein L21 [Flavobacteriales bacterium]|nr:50S ribosomal protein L21 [Flavobacteriales bacterium]